MMQRPWDCAQPDDWLPQSLRLCWGGSSGDGGGWSGDSGGGGWSGDAGGGWGGDSGGGWGGDAGGGWGATTGGGDWGSAGSADFSGSWAGGDVNAWAGTAYDASTAGTGAGGGGDWGSFSTASFPDSTPGAIFTDIAGPNPGVTTGGGDWGSAGTSSFAGTGGGPGGAMFGADLGAGAGAPGQLGGGGFWGDYSGGGGFTGGNYGGGGGGGLYGGGGQQGGGSFGGFGTAGTSAGGKGGGPLGASNVVAAAPIASRGETFADTVGGGSLAGPASGKTSSEAPTKGEAQVESAGDVDSGRADADAEPAQSDFGKPASSEAAPEAEAGPSLSDAAPAGMIGGDQDAAPASAGQTAAPTQASQQSNFGPQSVNADYQGSPYASDYDQGAPSQAYQAAAQQLSDLTQSALSGYDYQGSPYADMGQQPTAPDFNQAFQAFEAQPGWNPAEQTAGRAGLAEPTDWGANPFADFAPSQAYQDAAQQLSTLTQTALDPLSGMDLAGDMRTETGAINPNSTFQLGWEPANAYAGRGVDDASGRAAQDYVTSLVSAAPLAAASPAVLSAISALSGISVPGLLGGTATTGGILGTLAADRGTTPLQSPQQPITVEIVQAPSDRATPLTVDPSTTGRLQDAQPLAAPPVAPTETAPEAPPQAPPTAPPEAPESRPAEQPPEAPPQAPPQQPPEAPPQAPPEQPQTPPQQTPQTPPSLIDQAQQPPPQAPPAQPPGLVTMLPPPALTPPAQPAAVPQQQPPPQPGEPGEPDHDEEGEPTTPARPGTPLGAPTTRTQNTPISTARVRQEQQAGIRNRPINEALHGILTRAAEHAGVVVRVGSGGQIGTRSRADYKQHGGWTGSIRHNHGNAADVRLEVNGRILSFNNAQDRPIMEAFVREAARLGATGMGAGVNYMGVNTIHVGFGTSSFWKADNPGSRALQQAWNEGRQGPANRPPADIPVRTAQIPLPRRRPEDTAQPDVPPAPPTAAMPPPAPPTEVPPVAARPPPDIPLPPAETPAPVAPVDRPPADIPPTLTSPVRGRVDPVLQARFANDLLKDATKNLTANSGEAEFQAASVVAAKALAAAGIPAAMARSLMAKGAYEGAARNGFDINSWPMGGVYKGKIDGGIDAALQGYQPAKPGEVQGPPSPFAPGKQGALPFGQQSLLHLAAGGRDVGAPPAITDDFPGRNYGEGEIIGNPNLMIEDRGFGTAPPAPPTGLQDPNPDTPFAPAPPFAPNLPGEQRGERQASLLDFLQNFNPISTAEARSGRSQAGNLQAPRADPGTIQSRLSSQRSNVVNDLQTNLGLRNTLDLIVTGEVGSQGKAAVLGFLETAMNKVAAEASREGRAPTGRDLLQYLNNRSYFPDTWGKIESGKIKGGALTDDLLDVVAGGSNTTKGSTGNSSAKSAGSRFGGNPTNVTIGKEHYGVESYGHHAAWYNALGALEAPDTAVGSMPPMPAPAPAELRGLAKGGRVDKDEPVVVGEEGPEFFVPDRPGTVLPHMPQPGKGKNIDRWPKLPAPDYPGRYGGVEREILRQTRAAQDPSPGLMDLIDSGRLPLNEANWRAMLNDPSLIALGRSRMDDRRESIDPGAEQYGAFIPAPGPAAEPPDPSSQMAQALGYGSIKRRPMRIGRQDYPQ